MYHLKRFSFAILVGLCLFWCDDTTQAQSGPSLLFYCAGDLDGSGVVDDADLELVAAGYRAEDLDLFEVVAAAVSYGDVCDQILYLPVVLK